MEQHPDDAAAAAVAAAAASESSTVALCASCDRCRTRKTKCDGGRPCSNCAAKYMKKNFVSSIEGVALEKIECVYSPAKRRGPVPGRYSGQKPKGAGSQSALLSQKQQSQKQKQQQGADWQGVQQRMAAAAASGSNMVDPAQLAAFLSGAASNTAAASSTTNGSSKSNFSPLETHASSIQQQLSILQQLQQQAQQQIQQQDQHQASDSSTDVSDTQPKWQRVKLDESSTSAADGTAAQQNGIPRTIMSHTHLLERSDTDGSRLRAYFKLSIDELFRLPMTPTDEQYCIILNIPGLKPSMLPGSHLAALSAVRFAEVALGALVHNEVSLAMELCNAVVHCLRESVQEPVQMPVMFEVAKAYFLLGVFRACRGDMARYFKYRRVCLTYLSKLENTDRTNILLAAVSYLDSWAYMVYNANEDDLPDVDQTIPPVQKQRINEVESSASSTVDPIESKYNIKTDPMSVACDPKNKNWIQGAPPVYLNNEAPVHARVLDALACAVRTCCDQANTRFAEIAKEVSASASSSSEDQQQEQMADLSCGLQNIPATTPTATAVLANENELCSRNMVLSAYTLMQSSENRGEGRNEGHHLVISAMDAFLENGDESIEGGFTDSQIQSLLSVCNTAVENPFILHHAGPTYHMVSNAAILLCHLLNGMHAMKSTDQFGAMEATMFEEVVDTFISIRKLLTIHRRKLPVKLRCHGIPRPSFEKTGSLDRQPFVDLGETLLCPCRGCQGFVLMACSPCVAAERARSASQRMEVSEAQEAEVGDINQIMDDQFDLDDDALLNMISNLISS